MMKDEKVKKPDKILDREKEIEREGHQARKTRRVLLDRLEHRDMEDQDGDGIFYY